MFNLVTVKDSVKLSPGKLRHDFVKAIILALNQNTFDVLEAADPYVHSGEASAYVKVRFRLIVFRPFIGEILEGTIRSSTEEGIYISVNFFDDILIHPGCMQPGTTFDPTEQVWAWNYEENRMFLDAGERIRFRVVGEQFEETAPLQKEALMRARATFLEGAESPPVEDKAIVPAPFRLLATIAEDGLGLIRWWTPQE